jgi:hypothetical protein
MSALIKFVPFLEKEGRSPATKPVNLHHGAMLTRHLQCCWHVYMPLVPAYVCICRLRNKEDISTSNISTSNIRAIHLTYAAHILRARAG